MSYYPTVRNASPQAWRRLRKGATDSEKQAIAKDIANILVVDVAGVSEVNRDSLVGTIHFALASFNWDERTQA